MAKNVTMTATPVEIITKLVEKEAAINIKNTLVPEALLFAKMCVKSGGNGSKPGKGGRSPKRDKKDHERDIQDKREENGFLECFHCQRRGHTTENCLSKEPSDPPKSADTAAKASTETASTVTTSIENYWIVAS